MPSAPKGRLPRRRLEVRQVRTLLYEVGNVMLTATRAGSNSRTGPSGSPTDLRYARPGSLRRVAARSSRARCREMELSSYWPEHQPTRQRPSRALKRSDV